MTQKTIKIKIETPQVTEVEIALPFYGKNDLEKPTEYIKVDEEEDTIVVSRHNHSNEWFHLIKSRAKYQVRPTLNDFYPIEKVEFDMAFAEFIESISDI